MNFSGTNINAQLEKGTIMLRTQREERKLAIPAKANFSGEDFAAALKAGAALLWVRCGDSDRELAATRILEEAGGQQVHVHGRSPRSEESGSS